MCEESHKDDILLVNVDVSAKQAELCNWKRNNVYEELRDNGQKCISTLKETSDGVAPKARLVVSGFEEMHV